MGDRLERLGVALDDAGGQLHFGRLRLHLVGAVQVVVAREEDQLLLPLSDLPINEIRIKFFSPILGTFLDCTSGTFRRPSPT